jgi:glycosyltransferase involved in cell wall biosynthesis
VSEENQKPEVSVIVPCYNYGHLLSETLESLKKQTLSNWECIVIDDGSTDDTKHVAAHYAKQDNRFRYIYQDNEGLSSARNTGILSARGDFIQLLDADDFIAENKLLNQINLLKLHTEISIVYSEVRYFKTENPDKHFYSLNEGSEPWIKAYSTHEAFCTALMQNNLFAVNCALFRKEIISNCGLFNTKLKSVEDWEFWVRCSLQHKLFLFDEEIDSIALVRIHGSSMSQNLKRMHEASLLARKGLRNIIHDCPLKFRKKLSEINAQQIAYLNRKLYEDFNEKNRVTRLKLLFSGYPLRSEWRHVAKEIFRIIGA